MKPFACPRCAKSLRGVSAFCPRCGLGLPGGQKRAVSPGLGKRLRWIAFAGAVAMAVVRFVVYSQPPETPVDIPSSFHMPLVTSTTTVQSSIPASASSLDTSDQQLFASFEQAQEEMAAERAARMARVPVFAPVAVQVPPTTNNPWDRFPHRRVQSDASQGNNEDPTAGQ